MFTVYNLAQIFYGLNVLFMYLLVSVSTFLCILLFWWNGFQDSYYFIVGACDAFTNLVVYVKNKHFLSKFNFPTPVVFPTQTKPQKISEIYYPISLISFL